MELKRLTFLPSFALGIAEIDDDHRRLIELSNAIADAIERGDFVCCDSLFAEFMEQCRAHFGREERHLYASGYPEAAVHAVEHQELMRRATETREYCRNQVLHAEAGGCYAKLIEFLIADILKADIRFKSFIEASGYRA